MTTTPTLPTTDNLQHPDAVQESGTNGLAGAYTIDPAHSRIGFVARHAMVTKVRGSFNEFEGTGYFDPADLEHSHLELTIQTASVDTRNADRDGHLRSADFFDAEQFPTMSFRSTAIAALDDVRYRVRGDLTIRNVTRPVAIEFEILGTSVDPDGNQRLGLDGSAVVSRKEWGLTWNTPLDAGGVLVGDKVTLEFEVGAVRNDPS